MSKRFNCDPCGISCLLVLYSILIYSDLVFVNFFVFTPQLSLLKLFNCVIFQTVIVLLVWSHAKASFFDPGIVLQPKHNLDFSMEKEASSSLIPGSKRMDCNEWSVCNKCETYRPPKAHHCRICQRCIRKMDHHCPWINNCVGELNQKFFLQFLFYVGVLCLQTLISILLEFMKHEKHSQSKVIHTVVLLVESLLFGIFVTAVITDQLQAIFNVESTLERQKGARKTSKSKPKLQRLSEVFGSGPSYLWMFPCRTIDSKRSDHFIV